jgi:hypothetical protein
MAVTPDEIGDPAKLKLETRVYGTVMQSSNTSMRRRRGRRTRAWCGVARGGLPGNARGAWPTQGHRSRSQDDRRSGHTPDGSAWAHSRRLCAQPFWNRGDDVVGRAAPGRDRPRSRHGNRQSPARADRRVVGRCDFRPRWPALTFFNIEHSFGGAPCHVRPHPTSSSHSR